MINKDSRISLNYSLTGESLVKAGVYTVAKVNVINGCTDKEVFSLISPSRTVCNAVYSKATKQTTLSGGFVEMALELPRCPKGDNRFRWMRTPLGRISQQWKKMSDEQKIKFHIEQYVLDMEGEEFSYEII
jgi:hypothetical protein